MILYLHGFNSSPASHKARVMAEHMSARGWGSRFLCPDLPHLPGDAIALLKAQVERHPPGTLTLVGSSLGGFYATWLAECYACRAVLLQPAVRPHVGLEAYLGKQKNLYTGAEFELTRAHLEGWRDLHLDKVDAERYLLILETGDEVLDYREAVQKYAGARMVIRQGGDHMLQSFQEHIPRILAFANFTA